MNSSVQSAYSWGIAIVLFVVLSIGNVMYVGFAYPYARVIERLGRDSRIVNPLPFGKKETDVGVTVKGDVEAIEEEKEKDNGKNNNFVTLEEAVQKNS